MPEVIDRQECLSHRQDYPSQGELVYRTDGFAAASVDLSSFILYPSSFALHPAFPNPFNAYVTLKYDIPAQTHVTMKVFDLSGREVAVLVDGIVTAGQYQAAWDARLAASGVYICWMDAGGFSESVKLVLTR